MIKKSDNAGVEEHVSEVRAEFDALFDALDRQMRQLTINVTIAMAFFVFFGWLMLSPSG